MKMFSIKIKPWLACTLLALAGCSSEPATQWYVLPTAQTPVSAASTAPLLVVRTVELAPHLNSSGLIYRTSKTQVIEAQQNLWAQDLAAQLTQRIVTDLRSKQRHYWTVAHNPMMKTLDTPTLLVTLNQFNGVYTGHADIQGEWSLVDGSGVLQKTQAFSYHVPLNDEGYPALVEALSQGFNQVTQQISQQL